MGGAFNVGANITAMDKVLYVEYNRYVFEIIEWIIGQDAEQIIHSVKQVIENMD